MICLPPLIACPNPANPDRCAVDEVCIECGRRFGEHHVYGCGVRETAHLLRNERPVRREPPRTYARVDVFVDGEYMQEVREVRWV